jgi:mycothiol synthase
MAGVTVRPHAPADDERIVEIMNRIYEQFPPHTLALYRHDMDLMSRHERDHVERFVAVQEGQVLGGLLLEYEWWVQRPNVYWAEIAVDMDRWGQGFGSRLFDLLLGRAAELGAGRLYGHYAETMTHAREFLTHRGFNPTGRGDRLSRLDVRAANVGGYDGLEDQLREQGIRVTSLAEIGPDNEDFLCKLYDMEFETGLDIPSSEEMTEEPRSFDVWRTEMLTGPGRSPESLFVAVDGERPVGVARVRRRAENAATNGYTGVDRKYRGRGIARALKLRTIEWARQNGVDFIYTSNDVENKPMLAINVNLGYQPLPSMIEVVKILAEDADPNGA